MPAWNRSEDVIETANYVYKKWLNSPLVETFFRHEAGAAEARLATAISELRASSLIIGAADLALTLGIPVAAWIGMFAAMGAPYAQARGMVRSENFLTGFSQGFVMGLLKWEWQQAVSRFGRFSPGQANGFDESLSYERANALNAGLKAGFTHARLFNEQGRKTVLNRIKMLANSKPGEWNRLNQISYVIDLAAAARSKNIFR